jgi:hypothetical protein
MAATVHESPARGLDLDLEGVGSGPVATGPSFGPLADKVGYLGRRAGRGSQVVHTTKDTGVTPSTVEGLWRRGETVHRLAGRLALRRQDLVPGRLVGGSGAGRRHHRHDRHQDRDAGAVRGDVLGPGVAAMGSGHLSDDREAQPGAAAGA